MVVNFFKRFFEKERGMRERSIGRRKAREIESSEILHMPFQTGTNIFKQCLFWEYPGLVYIGACRNLISHLPLEREAICMRMQEGKIR